MGYHEIEYGLVKGDGKFILKIGENYPLSVSK